MNLRIVGGRRRQIVRALLADGACKGNSGYGAIDVDVFNWY